jgi:hypothetical protein
MLGTMAASDFALIQGLRTTKGALVRWNLDPWPTLRGWLTGAALVTAGLLVAVLVIGWIATPDSTPVYLAGLNGQPHMGDVADILKRNSLVLALHSFACLAGFIAGTSLPAEAARYRGIMRTVHDHAGPLAIGFVVCATSFSLITQAYVLGNAASTLSAQNHMAVPLLLLGILPHAIPELIALFLPLAAWIIASRRGDWHELLAATFVTTALAAPLLIIAALLEVFVSPHLIILLRG